MIKNMREKGMSIRSIARELHTSRNSVRKYLNSEPSGKQERKRGSKLDPYIEKIKALIEGHNILPCCPEENYFSILSLLPIGPAYFHLF